MVNQPLPADWRTQHGHARAIEKHWPSLWRNCRRKPSNSIGPFNGAYALRLRHLSASELSGGELLEGLV
jgi:hypothetical protein